MGLDYAVVFDSCFASLLVICNVFFIMKEKSVINICHVGCNGCLCHCFVIKLELTLNYYLPHTNQSPYANTAYGVSNKQNQTCRS